MTTLLIKSDKSNSSLKAQPVYILDQQHVQIEDCTALTKYTPIKEDIVYVFPDTNIVHTRLKTLSAQFGFQITKDINKATIAFTTRKINIFTTVSEISVDASKANKILNLNSNASKTLLITELRHWGWDNVVKNVIDIPYDKLNYNEYYISTKPLNSSLHFRLYRDTAILRLLTEDNDSELTPHKFSSLSKLLKSHDKESFLMGFEILKGLDYVSNALYILVLFKEYGFRIPKTIKIIKSMCAYYGMRPDEMTFLNAGRLITVLKHINQYNENSVNQLGKIFKLVYQAESNFNMEDTDVITDSNEIEL